MTVQSKTAARPNSVTTGAIAGSRKIYTSPAGRPDINVPFREIALDPSAREEPYRAYDCSGPYTDPAVTIDLEVGLPPVRAAWLAKRGFDRIAAARCSRSTMAAHPATVWFRPARRNFRYSAASRASLSHSSNSPAPALSPKR